MNHAHSALTFPGDGPSVGVDRRPAAPRSPGADTGEGRSREADARARALSRFRIAALGYSALFAMALVLVAFGLLPRRETLIITGYCALGQVAFYLLLRSRRAQRFADPSCAFAQVLFGISTLLIGCVLIPQDRVAAVQIFSLIIAFDLTRLSRRQVSMAAASTVVGLLGISISVRWMTGDDATWHRELVSLAMTVVYLPLLVTVGKVVRRRMDQQSSQRAALGDALEQLQILSERDALTGAPNRRHGEALLDKEAVRRLRHRTPLSLGLLDIDFFKRINDSHGHAVGDAVLVALVQLIEDVLAPEFTLARWGGEEFLIVMPETVSGDAAAAMRCLRDAVSAADWTACAPALRVEVSIGVCEFTATSSIQETLERADVALYQAKNQGRGRVVEHTRAV